MASRSLNSLLQSLTRVGRGDAVQQVASADRINAIQDAIRLLIRGDNIQDGENVRKKSADGYVILSTAAPRVHGGGAAVQHFPWETTLVLNTVTNFFETRVRPGTINSMLPTNMFSTSNNAIELTGTFYVTLDCTTDGDSVTDAVVDFNSTVPPDPMGSNMGVAPSDFSVLLAVIVDRAVFQVAFTNFNAQPQTTIFSLKGSPVPGAPFFDINYTWVVVPGI